jgi:hypothetical protein
MNFFPKVLDFFAIHKHVTKVLDFWFAIEILKIHRQVWIYVSIFLYVLNLFHNTIRYFIN